MCPGEGVLIVTNIIFAGLIVGALSVGQFGDAVSLFREEIERNHAWGKVGRRTVESTLGGLESCYNTFEAHEYHNAKDTNLLISHEYHMFSIIHQETSLRTDSSLVNFLKSDLVNLLDTLYELRSSGACHEAINAAKSSLSGSFNYRGQSGSLLTVSKKCK